MNFTELSLSKTTIYKEKLLHNITQFKDLLKADTAFMAVIKANAYGHGAVNLARFMEESHVADYFGLAQLSEAIELRAAGIQTPLLLFNAIRLNEIDFAIEHQVTLTVFSKELALAIVKRAENSQKKALVHLKIDSGMGRIGVRTFNEAYELYQLLDSDSVSVEGIYTHFADATHKEADNFTVEQFARFQMILNQFSDKGIQFKRVHACNTAATINFPDYHLDMVRVGIGLYGFNPSTVTDKALDLQPIQNVQGRITYLKDFPAGQSIGYNRHYFSTKPMMVATAGIGYADGVDKNFSNQGYLRFQGQKLPIIGDVCMDQTMLDASEINGLQAGDYLSYFGDPADGYSSADELAELINGSVYELLCALGQRVERIYQ